MAMTSVKDQIMSLPRAKSLQALVKHHLGCSMTIPKVASSG